MPVRDTQTHRQTNKPVGFYGPIAPRVPNAPSTECPSSEPRNNADATFLNPNICRRLPVHAARHAASTAAARCTIGGRLPEWQTSKCISSVSFVRIESNFYSARNARIASAVLATAIPSVRLSVCPSVRLSHAGIVSKRRHVARCSFHRWIAKCV